MRVDYRHSSVGFLIAVVLIILWTGISAALKDRTQSSATMGLVKIDDESIESQRRRTPIPVTPRTPKPTEPTQEPTTKPTQEPTTRPTQEPTTKPTQEPTTRPTQEPTTKPTQEPTTKPTQEPTTKPTQEPTTKPTQEPTTKPTQEPTTKPTQEPTTKPTQEPTTRPTQEPTPRPTRTTVDPDVASRRNLTIVSDTNQIEVGKSVTFHLDPDDGFYDFEFDFGDKTSKQTKPRSEATITHSFTSVGPYIISATAKAPVRPRFRGSVQTAAVNVVAVIDPPPPPPPWHWIWFLIPIVLVVLLIAGILKVMKSAVPPRPSFTSQIDVGSTAMDQANNASLVNAELHLDPNVREGLFDVSYSEPSFISAERSQL